MKTKWYVALVLLALGAAEYIFRNAETSSSGDTLFNYFFYDEKLRRRGLIQDGGVFHANYQMRVNQRGFRDAKSWPPTPDKNRRRIVVGAAGHGYGENLSDEEIYVHRLEKSLNQIASIPIDIFNLSVQGSTILFFERALLNEVLQSKPDTVILSYGGFNEALQTSLPEASVLFPHNPLYNLVMSSATVRASRQWIGSFRGRRHRVTPKEMIASYTRIHNELQKTDTDLFILQQLVVFPDIEGLWKLSDMDQYRQELLDFSREKDIPLIDPLAHCPDLEICFERMEWYSAAGHEAVLQSFRPHFERLSGGG